MSIRTTLALVLGLVSTTLTNLAYLREHDAAAELPVLCMRRPLHSAHALVTDRSWMLGFAMESGGFLLYAVALALASLALVQSVTAGGIGVLAFASARIAGHRLSRRELRGALISVAGLAALAISLAGGSGEGGNGTTGGILLWLGGTASVALVLLAIGPRLDAVAVTHGLAGGLFFSIGDVATKVATQGGARLLFVVALIAGYTVGTALLQIGYQAGEALTVAGLATLLTNAVPIAAGTIVLSEPVPSGALGGLRVLAYAAVTVGAVLLARPEKPAEQRSRLAAAEPEPEPS
jgi:drug/metabolite transporter (DMT)-like permease